MSNETKGPVAEPLKEINRNQNQNQSEDFLDANGNLEIQKIKYKNSSSAKRRGGVGSSVKIKLTGVDRQKGGPRFMGKTPFAQK